MLSTWALLVNALSGCVSGGEEVTREDDNYYVNLVRWEATRSDGTSAGSDCTLKVGEHLAFVVE